MHIATEIMLVGLAAVYVLVDVLCFLERVRNRELKRKTDEQAERMYRESAIKAARENEVMCALSIREHQLVMKRQYQDALDRGEAIEDLLRTIAKLKKETYKLGQRIVVLEGVEKPKGE